MIDTTRYYKKYLKYKNKYLELSNKSKQHLKGGGTIPIKMPTGITTACSKQLYTLIYTLAPDSLQQILNEYDDYVDTYTMNNKQPPIYKLSNTDFSSFADGITNIETVCNIFVLSDIQLNINNFISMFKDQFFNTARLCFSCGKPLGPSVTDCNNPNCKNKAQIEPNVNKLISVTTTSNLVSFLYHQDMNDRFAALILSYGRIYDTDVDLPTQPPQKLKVLVYVDVLDLSLIHLNAIPFNIWVPDITALFNNSAFGIQLITALRDKCVLHTQYVFRSLLSQNCQLKLNNKLSNLAQLIDNNAVITNFILNNVIHGFNFPPSEGQLHLQWMFGFFKDLEYLKIQSNVHLTTNRFIFYDMLLEALNYASTCDSKILATMRGNNIGKLKKPTKGSEMLPTECEQYFIEYYKAISNGKYNQQINDNRVQAQITASYGNFTANLAQQLLPQTTADIAKLLPQTTADIAKLLPQNTSSYSSFGIHAKFVSQVCKEANMTLPTMLYEGIPITAV